MSYHRKTTRTYQVEYSIYCNAIVFVHYLSVHPIYRGQGVPKVLFGAIKKIGLPIVLESHPRLVRFYEKYGFKKMCETRDGFLEMAFVPSQSTDAESDGDE